MNVKPLGACALALIVSSAHAAVIQGPFVANTGSWTPVTNGGFETGDTTGWAGSLSAVNDHPQNASLPYTNTYAGKLVSPADFPGSGFAVLNSVSVQQNTDYVVSGFFYRTATTGFAYIDFNDIAGEPTVLTDQSFVGEWQFAHIAWNSGSNTNVTLRVVMDNGVTQGQTMYFDEIAVTLADDFEAPAAVPEPFTLALALPALALLRRKR